MSLALHSVLIVINECVVGVFTDRQVLEQMYITSGQMPLVLLILSITQSILQVHILITTAVCYMETFGSVSKSLLTSLAVIPSVSRSTARMQKTVILSPTRSKDTETDDHAGVVVVVLRCGESTLNCPLVVAYQLVTLRVCTVTKI